MPPVSDFAQYDNDVRSERTKAGMRAALEAGQWTFSCPLGYRRRAAGRNGAVEIDPVSGPLIKKAFELYATGLYFKADVLRKVTALGLRTRHGKALTVQTFQEMLRKPIYAGFMCVPRWAIDHVRGNFDALVAEDVFNRVQAILEGRALTATPHQRNHPDFPLRLFVRCAECGTPITGSRSKGRTRLYPYYRCRNNKCHSVKMTKEQFERHFVDYLGGLRPKLEYLRLFREIILDVWKAKQELAKSTTAALVRHISGLEQNRQDLLEAHLYRKVLKEQVYRNEDNRLDQEIAIAKIELHEGQIEEFDIEGVLSFAETIILDARRLWIEGTLDQRQRLQKVLFPKGVTYSNQSGFGTTETSLFFQWLAVVEKKNKGLASPTGFEGDSRKSTHLQQLLTTQQFYNRYVRKRA
jgi:site-specific DNA recombinase